MIENASSEEINEPPGNIVTVSLSGLIIFASTSFSECGYGPYEIIYLNKLQKKIFRMQLPILKYHFQNVIEL